MVGVKRDSERVFKENDHGEPRHGGPRVRDVTESRLRGKRSRVDLEDFGDAFEKAFLCQKGFHLTVGHVHNKRDYSKSAMGSRHCRTVHMYLTKTPLRVEFQLNVRLKAVRECPNGKCVRDAEGATLRQQAES